MGCKPSKFLNAGQLSRTRNKVEKETPTNDPTSDPTNDPTSDNDKDKDNVMPATATVSGHDEKKQDAEAESKDEPQPEPESEATVDEPGEMTENANSNDHSLDFIFAFHTCDQCGKTPLFGTCFQSKTKENWDVCQECYEKDGTDEWAPITELYGTGLYTPEMQKQWHMELKSFGKMLVPYLNFGHWQSSINGGNPPTPQQEWEFANLLYKESFFTRDGQVNEDDVDIPDMPKRNSNDDELVSWKGIQLDWFLNTFCASPFMQRLQDFQCDCAFVRCVALPAIMAQTNHTQTQSNPSVTRTGPAIASLTAICNMWDIQMPGGSEADNDNSNDKPSSVIKDMATTVISYSGLYGFGFLVDALRAMENRSDAYVWIDFMSVNQVLWSKSKEEDHDATISGRQDFVDQFQNQIRSNIGHTTVVLQSWENLLVPLNQLWILFEAFMATLEKPGDDSDVEREKPSGIRFLMSTYFRQELTQRVLEGQEREVFMVKNQLQGINVADAVCADEIDKDVLLEQLQAHSSYDGIDEAVKERVYGWLIEQGRARIMELQSKSLSREVDEEDTVVKLLTVKRNMGMMLSHLGRLDDALPVLAEAFKKQQDLLGKNHLQTLMTLSSLGLVYFKLERHEEAEPYLKECFERYEQILGKDDKDTITAAVNLAQNLQAQDKNKQAEVFCRKVLAARTKLLGEDDPLTLKSMADLAALVWQSDQDKDVAERVRENEAQVLFEKVVRGLKNILGKDHPQTLDAMEGLATVLSETLQYEDAVIIYRDVVQGYRLQYGDTHSVTLNALYSLARTYQSLKQYDAAIEFFLEEIEEQKQLGEEEEALGSMQKLAALYREQARLESCVELMKEAIRGMEKVYGRTHIETLAAMCDLAAVLLEYDESDFEEIHSLYEKTIFFIMFEYGGGDTLYKALVGYADAMSKQYDMGDHTLELLEKMTDHGRMMVKRGDNRSTVMKAGELLRKVHEARKVDLGEDDERTLAALYSLAEYHERIASDDQEKVKAERLHEDCMEGRRRVLGDGHSDTMKSIEKVLTFLRKRSKLGEAEVLCRALVEAKKLDGDKEKFRSLCTLGVLLFHQDKLEEAEPLIREALAGQESLLGKTDPETLQIMDVLAGVLRKRKKLDEAEIVIREVIELRTQEQGEEHEHTVDSINDLIKILQDQGKLTMTDFVEGRRAILMGNESETKVETLKERWEENKKAIDWSLKTIDLDPRNKRLAKKAWREFGGDVLEPLLRSGAIALIDGSWLVDYFHENENPILCHRQDLPPEAFISLEDLIGASSSRGIHIALLSYMWLHPQHPDPKGETLKKVALWCQKSIESNLKSFLQFQNIPGTDLDGRKYSPKLGLFWDFASLHQHPEVSEGRFRTEKENELFQQGLAGLSTLFSHPNIEHVKCTKFPKGYPNGYNLPEGANVAEYSDRGWPLLESSLMGVAMIREKTNNAEETEVGRATTQYDITLETQSNTTIAPMSPDAFQKRLQEVSFTNKKDDLPIVMNLYRTAFLPRFAHVLEFNWSNADFNDEQVCRLAEIIELGYTPRLRAITVCGEELSAKGCEALGKAILAQPSIHLESLGLDHFPTSPNQHNPNIGDDAIAVLAKAITQIETVTLENTSVSTVGCKTLAQAMTTQVAEGGSVRLKALHLRGCKNIGDEAIQALTSSSGAIFAHVHTLCLRECELGDDGCEALAEGVEALPENATIPLKSLDLAKNLGIGLVGILQLARLVARCTMLETLYLGPELETEEVSKLLEAVAEHPHFKVDFHSFGHHAGSLGDLYKAFGVDSADNARAIRETLIQLQALTS